MYSSKLFEYSIKKGGKREDYPLDIPASKLVMIYSYLRKPGVRTQLKTVRETLTKQREGQDSLFRFLTRGKTCKLFIEIRVRCFLPGHSQKLTLEKEPSPTIAPNPEAMLGAYGCQ